MAPLSNMHETGLPPSVPSGEVITDSSGPLTTTSSASSSSITGRSTTIGLKKKRLQHYIRKLKKALITYDAASLATVTTTKKPHMSTFEALERAIQLISTTSTSSSSPSWSKRRPNEDISQDQTQMSTNTSQPTSDESAPASPAASSTSTSSVDPQHHRPRQSPSGQTLLSSTSAIPPSSSSDRLWGTVSLSLPDGIITSLWPATNGADSDLPSFDQVLQKNMNLLEVLQGKGAQTLLLNAFCGHSKRRMYARLRCGTAAVRPFELLCEFTPNAKNPSICSAQIQILCLESAFKASTSNSSTTVFTTRHNASCALIYLDSASIPHLGHFPSEITGKSLFTFIHADDVSIIQQAHYQLHATNGRLVSTPNLRLVSYNGTVIPVNSEWSAFVNPWTKSIEMIVGRHCINHRTVSALNMLTEPSTPTSSSIIPVERFRELDNSVHAVISRPILSEEPVSTVIVNDKMIKQEPMESQQSPPQNLRSYIDNVVENLVISQEEKQQIQEEIKSLQETNPVLSYNQINCLENVHRLLKSQSKFLDFDGKDGMKENAEDGDVSMPTTNVPLTRELLQQHNRKWEAECKDTWKKRLNMKRIASMTSEEKPPTKTPRIRSDPQAYSISTTPLPPTNNRVNHYSSTTTTAATPGGSYLPPLPYPPPTPLDQQAWSDYVKIVQLHLQNMGTFDHHHSRQSPPTTSKHISLQQYHHQRVQQERHLAALAMTFQQVQHLPTPTHHHQLQQQQPSAASSPFNALPSLN